MHFGGWDTDTEVFVATRVSTQALDGIIGRIPKPLSQDIQASQLMVSELLGLLEYFAADQRLERVSNVRASGFAYMIFSYVSWFSVNFMPPERDY